MGTVSTGAGVRRLLVAVSLALALVAVPWPASSFHVLAVGSQSASPSAEDFELTAESIEHTLDTNLITATGQVDVRMKDLQAQGERLEADLDRHFLQMPGPVALTTPSGTLTGEDLKYAWDKRSGSVAGARTTSQGIILSSQTAELSPGAWVLDGSLFTKCDLPTPEYAFLAKRLTVDPKTQLARGQGVRLALFGHTVLPLPDMRFSLKDTAVGRMSRSRLPVPSVGYDSTRGYFVADEFPVHLSDQDIILAGGGYGSLEGGRLTLSGLYAPSPDTTYRWNAVYQEHAPSASTPQTEMPSDIHGMVELSTLTRAGRLNVTAEKMDDDDHQDLAYIPRLELVPASTTVAGVVLTPILEWAIIREDVTAEETSRLLGGFSWSASPRLNTPFSVGFSGSQEWTGYGTGDALSLDTLSVAVAQPLTKTINLETRYKYQQYSGATPFTFDAPERYSEGELGLDWRSGANTLSASVIYDLAGWETANRAPSALGAPLALRGSASVNSAAWSAKAEVQYELADNPHYSTLNVDLIRHLHCFDLSLRMDQVTKSLSFSVVLR